MTEITPQEFFHNKIKGLTPYISKNEYDDVKWLNLIAALNNDTDTTDREMLGYHYISVVDLYKRIEELETMVRNLAALIAEK